MGVEGERERNLFSGLSTLRKIIALRYSCSFLSPYGRTQSKKWSWHRKRQSWEMEKKSSKDMIWTTRSSYSWSPQTTWTSHETIKALSPSLYLFEFSFSYSATCGWRSSDKYNWPLHGLQVSTRDFPAGRGDGRITWGVSFPVFWTESLMTLD